MFFAEWSWSPCSRAAKCSAPHRSRLFKLLGSTRKMLKDHFVYIERSYKMTWQCWGLINEKAIYFEVTSVSSSWSSHRKNIEALDSENHSNCLNKMQHKPCCWNVVEVSLHDSLLSFVIFQRLPKKMTLGRQPWGIMKGPFANCPFKAEALGKRIWQ